MAIPSRRGVPTGWEAFPWGYFQLLAELGIQGAPVIVAADPGGPELAYAKPGFRDALRSLLSSDTGDLRLAITRVIDEASR